MPQSKSRRLFLDLCGAKILGRQRRHICACRLLSVSKRTCLYVYCVEFNQFSVRKLVCGCSKNIQRWVIECYHNTTITRENLSIKQCSSSSPFLESLPTTLDASFLSQHFLLPTAEFHTKDPRAASIAAGCGVGLSSKMSHNVCRSDGEDKINSR